MKTVFSQVFFLTLAAASASAATLRFQTPDGVATLEDPEATPVIGAFDSFAAKGDKDDEEKKDEEKEDKKKKPTSSKSEKPTKKPTKKPTPSSSSKSAKPTKPPSERKPTKKPTKKPTPTRKPTRKPTKPTRNPTRKPTKKPTTTTSDDNKRCVDKEDPRPTRSGYGRFRFNLYKSDARCVDEDDDLYEYGEFKNVKKFSDCAEACVNDVRSELLDGFRGYDYICGEDKCRCLYDKGTLNSRNGSSFYRTNRNEYGYGSVSGSEKKKDYYCAKLSGADLFDDVDSEQ